MKNTQANETRMFGAPLPEINQALERVLRDQEELLQARPLSPRVRTGLRAGATAYVAVSMLSDVQELISFESGFVVSKEGLEQARQRLNIVKHLILQQLG